MEARLIWRLHHCYVLSLTLACDIISSVSSPFIVSSVVLGLFNRCLICPIVSISSDCLKGSSSDAGRSNTLLLISESSDCIPRRRG